jgi:CheY-like chemotaxis protein
VDDDPMVFPILQRYASGRINLETVVNADSALLICKEKQFDIIFMDINLRRGMDGKQLTEKIREYEAYKDIPIIAFTAYAMKGDKDEFLAAGCSHYVSKPFQKEDILRLLEEIL